MNVNSWIAKLTIKASASDIEGLREWLDEYARPVPRRNADVVSKYIRCVLDSNSEYDNVGCLFTLNPPRPVLQPSQKGRERDEWAEAESQPQPRSRLALAVDGLAALMVLACIGLIATHAFDPSPHYPIPWYGVRHATQLMLHHLVALCETC